MTSRIPATIDALVAAFTAAGIQTYDGPVLTGEYTPGVFVGYDADWEVSDLKSVSSTQTWASLGQRARTEDFTVMCGLVAVDGGGVAKTARDTAFALLAQVETVLRGNPSLGFSPPYVAQLESGDLFTMSGPKGCLCRIPFVIAVKTRI